MTKRKCDEAFEKSTFKQYWIINKKEESNYSYDSIREVAIYSNVYGPYKREEYLSKRKELRYIY
jgi:Uma2 family endonuclease